MTVSCERVDALIEVQLRRVRTQRAAHGEACACHGALPA
jgi:hypothetical protein